MVTEAKRASVKTLTKLIQPAQCMIVTDYRGLNTPEMGLLRDELRNQDAIYRVVKNRLMKIAANQSNASPLTGLLSGPSAIVFCQDDVPTVVRVLRDFRMTNQNLVIRGGLLGNQQLDEDQVMGLAMLPGRAQLNSELLGAIAGPLTLLVGLLGPHGPSGQLVRTLCGAAGGLVRVLDARAEQMGN